MCHKVPTTNSESQLQTHHLVHWTNRPNRKKLNVNREVSFRDQPPPFDQSFSSEIFLDGDLFVKLLFPCL